MRSRNLPLRNEVTIRVLVRVVFAAVLFAAASHAQSVTYTAQVGQESRLATVNVMTVEGHPSVSLKGIVSALGGQVKVSSNKVDVSLFDRNATLSVGDTEVSASQKFTIQHPPAIYENDLYIAQADVAPFFQYAFNVEIKSGQLAATADAAAGAPPMPARRKLRIVIDAGHGGTDPGATGQGPVPEKDIARAIADRVSKLIESLCLPAFTRAGDATLSTNDRISMANVALKGDLLVSIHVGASASKMASGFEFFCPMGTGDATSSRSLALARSMSNTLATSTGVNPRGVHQAPCRIFNNLQIPGVLVEVGFITNPKEEPLLVTPEYQDKLAQGIANGIIAYATGKAP